MLALEKVQLNSGLDVKKYYVYLRGKLCRLEDNFSGYV